jgi:hypothetical protein
MTFLRLSIVSPPRPGPAIRQTIRCYQITGVPTYALGHFDDALRTVIAALSLPAQTARKFAIADNLGSGDSERPESASKRSRTQARPSPTAHLPRAKDAQDLRREGSGRRYAAEASSSWLTCAARIQINAL